jgi:hypothetical protein
MPIDFTTDFTTSSTRNSALSLTSSTGLTINNQVIGGFHAYHSLNNIVNGSADNKIPPIFTAGGTTSQPTTLSGCNASSQCLSAQAAVEDGLASGLGQDITSVMEGELGISAGTLCSSINNDVIEVRNAYCEFEGSVEVTTPASLELNSDLVSSGRLQLGMIVYISEKSQAYQFIIDDYKTLYDNAETSGDITTTTFTTAVGDGNTGGEAFIDAWTIHKVEGELKNPENASEGVWSRDEANWKKYPNQEEYFAINNIPASEKIDDFNFGDAIIVVPDSWNNKKVISVSASIFTHAGTNAASTITLNQISPEGTPSTLDWAHPTNSKNSSSTFSAPFFTLQSGSTLHLSQTPKFGGENFGYTATFKVKG